MLRAADEDESAPLLRTKISFKSLTISQDDGSIGAYSKARVGYSPKVDVFSPQKLAIIVCVLLVELCERMSYYGVVANLILYCTSVLGFTSTTATTISLVYSGTVYLLPIAGGYIADAWSSRFNVIYASGLIYFCGLFSLLCSSIDFQSLFDDSSLTLTVNWRRVFYIGGLVLVAVGTGGIKANVGPFGAQQVQALGMQAVQIFFLWFYWFVNAGGLVAFSAIAYVQQNISFSWGYFIPFMSMFFALIFLNIARRQYIYKEGEGSVLGTTFKICSQAFCRTSPMIAGERLVFDSARRSCGGDFEDHLVDGVIAVVGVLPIFFFVVMFWAIYSQMQTTYFLQGERMDLHLAGGQIPVAMLNAFNIVAVMVVIPILDRVIYPCFAKLGRPLTHLQRMGVGFILSACSVFIAGWLEIERKKKLGFSQKVGDEEFYAANVTVLLQAPQFAFIGAGEAFTSITGLEFAYTQAPSNMQGAVMGLFLATNGLGSYVSSAIIEVIRAASESDPWFPNEINDGKVENVFFTFGGLMILFFIGYLPTAWKYKYRHYGSNMEEEVIADAIQSPRARNITIL